MKPAWVRFAAWLLCAGLWAGEAVAADPDPAAGRRKAGTCNACHGSSGFKTMPRLGGQTAGYLVEAMRSYRAGRREHVTMRDVAGGLGDRDTADIAAYYASLGTAPAAEPGPEPDRAANCAACHGAQGREPVSSAIPRLAGQAAGYLELTLREYREGKRGNPVMQEQARALDDAGIAALAAYFSRLGGLSLK